MKWHDTIDPISPMRELKTRKLEVPNRGGRA